MNLAAGSYMAATLTALLVLLCGLLDAAPLEGNPMAAEERQLANLVEQGKQSELAAFNSPLNKVNAPQTKLLLQKTKIVIPIEEEEEKPAGPQEPRPQQPRPQQPHVAAPAPAQPMRFVEPSQAFAEDLTSEEHEFLFPADYELHSQDTQFPTYEDVESPMSSTDLDLTPRAVAEYLVLTGDFKGFDEALSDLMNAGMLTLVQVEQYRRVVDQEYERLVGEMMAEEEEEEEAAAAAAAYEQQQAFFAQPSQQAELREEVSEDVEATELLQALLQDYMMTENMDANSQEYEDFLEWVEKSLNGKQQQQQQVMAQTAPVVDVAAQELDQTAPVVDVAQELEQLPVEEEESSGEAEEPETFVVPSELSSTEKKLKKALEAGH